ncbi:MULTISPECIES: hypothetical protein [unclassified Streptomyces]|uniref:hypothetical protein n=1 Tax=unclassified Streptomyces TaxID=2593676 RepID=UPI002DDB275F|nr:hypothetical protein [Streptomyces sp. NBC_00243]WRZ17339.1 hypothetical protein OHT59_02030 [Streptomyces sp. NBC_00243]
MTLTLTCKNCQEAMTGETEDELVARVQDHVRGHSERHGGPPHTVSREQVLARLHREQAKQGSQQE